MPFLTLKFFMSHTGLVFLVVRDEMIMMRSLLN